jgi:hypothetical protein
MDFTVVSCKKDHDTELISVVPLSNKKSEYLLSDIPTGITLFMTPGLSIMQDEEFKSEDTKTGKNNETSMFRCMFWIDGETFVTDRTESALTVGVPPTDDEVDFETELEIAMSDLRGGRAEEHEVSEPSAWKSVPFSESKRKAMKGYLYSEDHSMPLADSTALFDIVKRHIEGSVVSEIQKGLEVKDDSFRVRVVSKAEMKSIKALLDASTRGV